VKQGAQGAFAKTICDATIIVETALGGWLLYFRKPAQLHQNLLGWNFLADSCCGAQLIWLWVLPQHACCCVWCVLFILAPNADEAGRLRWFFTPQQKQHFTLCMCL